ncbi:MAG: methyltransferase domain-containing protein [Betaproteobacteria bacterium]|jgi:malonyl-CoA O-methyltransferase|nr:methyltransferase domain-containing protein [Betaproteobacteria bacterium]
MPEAASVDLVPTIDPVASERWSKRNHLETPWLHEEIGRRMEERLQWIRLQPKRWVDWAPVNGGLATHAAVRARYPKANCLAIETSGLRLQKAKVALTNPWWTVWKRQSVSVADLANSLQQQEAFDMVWANMALHTAVAPQSLLRAWHSLLATDGFLMFSSLGPDTLRELQPIYQDMGWGDPSHAFTDMHDWGDMLVQAGFAEPVMDMERITLTYATPSDLLKDLRLLGRNLHHQRYQNLRGRGWRQSLESALWTLAKPDQGGRLVLTVEVIYGHALKPLPKVKLAKQSSVTLAQMKTLLSQSRGNTPLE